LQLLRRLPGRILVGAGTTTAARCIVELAGYLLILPVAQQLDQIQRVTGIPA